MHKKKMGVVILVGFLLIASLSAYFVIKSLEKNNSKQIITPQTEENPSNSAITPQNPIIPSVPSPVQVPKVNEQTIKYLLESMGANELHNPPFSSDTPKIEMYVSGEYYTAEIKKKVVYVTRGECAEEDIKITTTNEEVIKMIQDPSYIVSSFEQSYAYAEMLGSKTTLFMKGYLSLYKKITGEELEE